MTASLLVATSRLLLDGPPLVILPALAVAIGLNEAVFLQQLHYWLQLGEEHGDIGVTHDGRRWVYNTIPQWCGQFPYLSTRTLQRVISKLSQDGLVIIDTLARFPEVARRTGRDPRDRIGFYTIDYDRLAEIAGSATVPPAGGTRSAACQIGALQVASTASCTVTDGPALYRPETTSEITQQHHYAQTAGTPTAPNAAAVRKIRHQRESGIVWFTPDDTLLEVEHIEATYSQAEINAAISNIPAAKEPVPGVVERVILAQRRQVDAEVKRLRSEAEQHRRATAPCEDRETAARKAMEQMAAYIVEAKK